MNELIAMLKKQVEALEANVEAHLTVEGFDPECKDYTAVLNHIISTAEELKAVAK